MNVFESGSEMKFYNKIILLFLLFNNSAFSLTSAAIDHNWQKIAHHPFVIYYGENDSKKHQLVLKTLHKSYQKLSQEIGGELQDSIAVFICPSEKVYRQFVGENFPNWSEGVASPSNNVIILKSPNLLPDHAVISKIAIHELTHIILHKAVNGHPIPRWFNEGMAVYYSGEKSFASGSLISKALITKSIIDLKDINEVLNFHSDKAQLAYQESYLAILYLFEQFGKEKVKQIISLMGKGKNLDLAFLEAIGMDTVDFEYDWYHYIKKQYRWRFLIDFDTYLWIFILALFLVGFMIIRRRNRLTIQRWENDENSWSGDNTFTSSQWNTDDTD